MHLFKESTREGISSRTKTIMPPPNRLRSKQQGKAYPGICPVSTITHQQVRLCENTFFDHVTSQEMCRPSPLLKCKLCHHQRIGDGNSKINS